MGTGEIRSLFFGIHLADSFSQPLATAHKLMDNFKTNTQGASAGINQFTNYIHANQKALQALGPEIALIGAAMGLYYKDGVKEAATLRDVHAALTHDLGDDTDEFVRKVKEASGGMLTEVDIIKNANLAKTMGIEFESIPTMTKVARAAVRRFGGDMDYYYDSIVRGTARQSKLILDNLGIIVSVEEANATYAASIGKTSSELTENEQRLAFQAAMMRQAGPMIDSIDWSQNSYNESTQQLNISLKELQMVLSDGLIPILTVVVDITQKVVDVVRSIPKPVLAVIGILGALFAGLTIVIGAMLTQSMLMGMLGLESITLTASLGILAGMYVSLGVAIWGVVVAAAALLLELLPFIVAGGIIIGLLLILQDLVMNGYDNSELKKLLDYLCEKVPWLIPLVTALEMSIWAIADALAYLEDKLKPVVDQFEALNKNPAFQAMTGVAQMFVPGMQGEGVKNMYGAYQSTSTAINANAAKQGVTGTNVAFNFGDVKTERMTRDEFHEMVRGAGSIIEGIMNRANEQDMRSVGAW